MFLVFGARDILRMPKISNQISLCAQTLPGAEGSDAPEWVHLLPSGSIPTGDRRGPYHVTDPEQLIALSGENGMRLTIDENHATDLAAPKGLPAPARGWIIEMQARADGIWGRVEWTKAGRELVSSRAYRALSPVIMHDKAKRVLRILRASLVNQPNLRGLVALNMETDDMSFQERLAELLGLGADATETAIQSAVQALSDHDAPALQSRLTEIGTALGVAEGGDVLAAAQAAAKPGEGSGDTVALQSAVTALQAENAEMATRINGLTETTNRSAAEVYVDGEIKRGRVGVRPLRDHYISMHMEDATRVEKEIGALPVLSASGATVLPPAAAKDGEIALNAEQANAAKLLGIPVEDYKKTLQSEQEVS